MFSENNKQIRDGGVDMLKKFLQKHEMACRDNWICQALDLLGAVVEPKLLSPIKVGKDSQKRKRRHDLAMLLHS